MPISIDEKNRIFTLHTKHSTYQIEADSYGILRHLYYGPRAGGSADYLYVPADRGMTMQVYDAKHDRTWSQDAIPQEYPSFGTGDMRSPAFVLQNPDKSLCADLRYKSYTVTRGKYSLPGLPHTYFSENDIAGDPQNLRPSTLAITLQDKASCVEVQLLYGVFPKYDIITRAAVITNFGKAPVTLKKALSASLDFTYGNYDLLTFYGRHAMERNLQRQEVRHGVYGIGSARGASSHQYNPFMILAERDAGETHGNCYAMEFVWSGGFTALTEKDQFDQTRWQMGCTDSHFSYPLKSGESFVTPEVLLSFSAAGFEQLTINLHDMIREHLLPAPWKDRVRPLLLNSWEGCYFDFDGEKILRLAKDAKELGLDMLVMDDGWFGKRDDDTTGLGDWYTNEGKLGMSLGSLIRRVHEKGLLFGIWIEPEMVSEDSELFRKHPGYALRIPGRPPVIGRSQMVLDFSRKEVVDCIFEQFCNTFAEEVPDYIKWDFNRSLCEAFSENAADQGSVFYRYMLGTYDLLSRFREKWPAMLIEGCAGGGGRFDAGMLYYTPQIWCSDNTDAIDRIRIQYGTSFGYPSASMGAHVSVSPNEQNGRVVPYATRAAVAMAGTFGYELDPGQMTASLREETRRQVQAFRKYAPLSLSGDYLRLSNPFTDPVAAWEIVAKDGSEAYVTAVTLEIQGNAPQNYIRLRRLSPGVLYRDENTGKMYSADMLMHAGLPVPREIFEYASHVWHFIRVA
ncbi:MAG: alpha-galactosidase, partial [Candidatus Limivicinus sp.]